MDERQRKVIHAHYKRKSIKQHKGQILYTLVIIALTITFLLLMKNHVDNTKKLSEMDCEVAEIVKEVEDKVLKETTLKAEADITKAVLDVQASKAQRYITSISNEIEYLTLQEKGKYNITHSRLDQDAGYWKKSFSASSIDVNFDYSAIFSIKTSNITTYIKEGTVYIDYDTDNIAVKSIEVSETTTQSESKMFGKEYSNQEVLSLIAIAKDEIYGQLNTNEEIRQQSRNNLNTYFMNMAKKLEIDKLVINNQQAIDKGYEFVKNGTVKYNHSFEALDEVEYIVVHSTACPNITAETFYFNLNTYTQKRQASAHFYIDNRQVVEAIATNLESWNCGTKEPKIPCTNKNSISLEICEFENEEYQQQAITNAADFVKNVLVKQFPNAIVITHRSIAPTACPSILSDSQFEELFK